MSYKFWKFCENPARGTHLPGVYIPHFDQISVKISVFGLLYPNRCTYWGEIWRGGGTEDAKFHPNRCNVSPLRGEKPQNRPLGKLNTGALRQSIGD